MLVNEIFKTEVLDMTVEDLVEDINSLLDEYAPEGKTHEDFNGGYVQQLKNSTQLVAYFGTKPNTNNRDTVKIDIEPDELDDMYIMLKCKIHDIRNINKPKKTVSLAQRRLARKKTESIITNSDGVKRPDVF